MFSAEVSGELAESLGATSHVDVLDLLGGGIVRRDAGGEIVRAAENSFVLAVVVPACAM